MDTSQWNQKKSINVNLFVKESLSNSVSWPSPLSVLCPMLLAASSALRGQLWAGVNGGNNDEESAQSQQSANLQELGHGYII